MIVPWRITPPPNHSNRQSIAPYHHKFCPILFTAGQLAKRRSTAGKANDVFLRMEKGNPTTFPIYVPLEVEIAFKIQQKNATFWIISTVLGRSCYQKWQVQHDPTILCNVHSLKLTQPMKIDSWKRRFLLETYDFEAKSHFSNLQSVSPQLEFAHSCESRFFLPLYLSWFKIFGPREQGTRLANISNHLGPGLANSRRSCAFSRRKSSAREMLRSFSFKASILRTTEVGHVETIVGIYIYSV